MAQNLSNLPIGSKVKFGKYTVGGVTHSIVWLIVAKNHSSTPAYPSNSVTLLAERLIDALAVDAKEPSNTTSGVSTGGYAEYKFTNIDQWLNKDAAGGAWYVAAHNADAPPSNTSVLNSRGYDTKPAFLNGFSTYEKNAILNTTIRTTSVGSGTYDVVRKVFLPAKVELGVVTSTAEGATWEYFKSASTNKNILIASMTPTLYSDSSLPSRPSTSTGGCSWWMRTPHGYGYNTTALISSDGSVSGDASYSTLGIRPAINLSSSAKISDATDSDGCYTFIWNTAPPAPTTITVPTVYGGKTTSISWKSVVDPDGDAVAYQLECSINGGDYSQIYKGTATSYATIVTFGTNTVAYRVKAIDTPGASSSYTNSATMTVINNYAPVISGADGNLGVKSEGFTGTYSVTDANNNAVTVTESIDGVQIRSLVATLGATITYGITENTWLALPNGSHTLTIRATDGMDSSVRTYTFTKLVDSFTIQNNTPWQATERPSRIIMVITRNIPQSATFKVEVCNNGYDTVRYWEDITDKVQSGLVHVFENTIKTSANWGVRFRVTVNRNGSTGACYISAIGGNFE